MRTIHPTVVLVGCVVVAASACAVKDPPPAADALKEVLPATEMQTQAEAPEMVNPAQSREAAVQLARLLSESDPGAADFIEANHALRPLFAGGRWRRFEQLVQGYSFAEALAQLEEAMKGIGLGDSFHASSPSHHSS